MTINTVCVDDYIAPGATDTASAFAAAIATGLKVTMTNRVYNMSGITISAACVLEGVGPQSIIRPIAGSSGPIIQVTGNGVKLADFAIDASTATIATSAIYLNGSRNVLLERLSISGIAANGAGVSLNNTTDLANNTETVVRDCTITLTTSPAQAIKINNSPSATVQSCRLKGAVWGVDVTGSSGSPMTGLLITDNEISGGRGGIYLRADTKTWPTVPPNVPYLDPTLPQSRAVRLIGNNIHDVSNYGILSSAAEVMISNNTIRNTGAGAASADYINSGIVVQGQIISISGNTLYNIGGQGIDCGGSAYLSVVNNVINTVASYGIELGASLFTVCTGNIINSAMKSTNAVFVGRGGSVPTAGIIVSKDPGAKNGGTIWGFNNGNAQTAQLCAVSGNVIGGTSPANYQQYGLYVAGNGDVTNTAVTGNVCIGAGSVAPIYNPSTTSNIVSTGNVT